jgi:hypothetical protein
MATTPNIPALVALAEAALAPWPAYAPCPTCGYGSHDYETIARACYPKVQEQRTALALGVRALAERVATLEAELWDAAEALAPFEVDLRDVFGREPDGNDRHDDVRRAIMPRLSEILRVQRVLAKIRAALSSPSGRGEGAGEAKADG